MLKVFDLIIDLPDGIDTMAVLADSPEEAYRVGKESFPGRRLALVLRDGQPGAEID